MQWFQNTFTRRVNTRHGLWGHLFGGRYKAILVEDQQSGGKGFRSDYLQVLIDYIHLNPARAGLLERSDGSLLDYPWSSVARGYAKPPTKRPEWISVREGLDLFGEKNVTRGRKRFVERLDRFLQEETRDRIGLVEREGQSLQSTLRRGDRRKAAVAWAICQQTNLRHQWIAERLQMSAKPSATLSDLREET